VSAAELAAMVASAAPPLVIDVRSSGGEGGIVAGDALASATSSPDTLRIPLAELSAAVRAGRLDSGRSRAVVCVCDTGAAAAQVGRPRRRASHLTRAPDASHHVATQAAVRLRRVFGFSDVAALRGGSAPP
jgi:rhodanese-related sulfurtransferase